MEKIKNFILKNPVGVGACILICVFCFAWYDLANPGLIANATHVNVFANNIVVDGTVRILSTEPGTKLEISGGTRFSYELEHDIYYMDIVPVVDGTDNVKYEFRMTDYGGLQNQAALTIRGQDGKVTVGNNLTVTGRSYQRSIHVTQNADRDTTNYSVITSTPNLHLDSKEGHGIYLNWYGGGSGTYFGNGASGQVGRMDGSGNLSMSGDLTVSGSDIVLTADGSPLTSSINFNNNDIIQYEDTNNIWTFSSDGTTRLTISGSNATVAGDLTVSGASTNFRNAIKAVDGSGSGIDADTVDGVQESSLARNARGSCHDVNIYYGNTWYTCESDEFIAGLYRAKAPCGSYVIYWMRCCNRR